MISYRDDVWLTGLKSEMVPVQIALLDIAHETGWYIVISGAMEGDHTERSKHWSGMALDCFCVPWSDTSKVALASGLKKRLPDRLYDVVTEATHIHVEFDPKIDKVTVQ